MGLGSSGERPCPLQSYVKSVPIGKAEGEVQPCLSGPLVLSLRTGLPWRCPALREEEAPGASVVGGAALVPLLWEPGPSAEVLWGVGRRLHWGLPRSLVLCLPQPRGLPPAASGSRDHSPAVVVTVVTVSALLVVGSVMSVLAMWRR